MRLRPYAHLVGLMLAISTFGCVDRNYEITDLSGKLEVEPLYFGIDEGFPAVPFTAVIDGAPVAVTWESSDVTVATVAANGMVTPLNNGFAAITATLTSNPSVKKSASFTVNELFGTPLSSGVGVGGIGGVPGNDPPLLYRIYVPAGTTALTITLRNGTGDLDVLVKRGPRIPQWDDYSDTELGYDDYSANGGNTEDITIADPTPGTWYILIDVWTAGGGATLTATVTP